MFEILKYECNCILQLQISRCAETFVALLQSITNRYKGLSDVTLQLQFIQLQVSKNAIAYDILVAFVKIVFHLFHFSLLVWPDWGFASPICPNSAWATVISTERKVLSDAGIITVLNWHPQYVVRTTPFSQVFFLTVMQFPISTGLFFGHSPKNSRWQKLKLKKLKTQEFFSQNSKFRQLFPEI